MIKLMVLGFGLIIIGFIAWWFFGQHEDQAVAAEVSGQGSQQAHVSVDGGFTPSTLVLKKGMPTELTFNRKDPSSCLEQVVFPDFGVNEFLPKGEDHAVKIDTSKAGEFEYSCGMHMFHGKIVIK